MDDRERRRRAAIAYYLQDQTMDAIAASFGVSRPTISRWLAQARGEGLVRIEVEPAPTSTPLADRLGARFGVRAHLVSTPRSATEARCLDAVAREGARLLAELVEDRSTVGIAWGTTVSTLVGHLPRRPLRGVTVVQMNGAANAHTSGVTYASDLLSAAAAAFDAQLYFFPTPAFFDRASTREALWQESSVQHVLRLRAAADVAVFGVGAVSGQLRSHVYSGGYLSREALDELARERVVGDICTHFLREDGTHADIGLNARASGPSPAELARIPRRLVVAAGENRVPALLGALRCGAVTDLVIDERTASALIARDDATR